MDPRDRPRWPWRLLAWTVLIFAGLMQLPAVVRSGAPSLQMVINWLAIAGTLAYAHGWPARPLWFWRVFALLFSFYTMATLGRLVGPFVAIVRRAPEALAVSDWTILLSTLALCFLVCIALLRHAGLLRGRQRQRARMYEEIFA